MFENLEYGDAKKTTEFFITRFHEKFLQPIGILKVFLVHLVAWWGSLKFLKFLDENGANIDAKDKHGRFAVYYAAHRGNDKMVKWLLEKKVSKEDKIDNFKPSRQKIVGRSVSVVNSWISFHFLVYRECSLIIAITISVTCARLLEKDTVAQRSEKQSR